MVYRYATKVGTFAIRPERTDPDRVEFWVEEKNECYGSYPSATAAASCVFFHSTGFSNWDSATELRASEDLNGWDPKWERRFIGELVSGNGTDFTFTDPVGENTARVYSGVVVAGEEDSKAGEAR